MSDTAKTVLGIVAVLVIAVALYYLFAGMKPGMNTGAPLTEESTSELPSGTDASDDGLEQDMMAIEAEMNAFVSDTAQIDAGLNDQPVEQESL